LEPSRGPDDPAQQLYLESLALQLTGWNNPRQRLAQAFSRDEFILYQQQIRPVSGEERALTFLEVLIRHEDEEKNLTPPGAFLPVLEYYNQMQALDRWVTARVLSWYEAHARGRPMLFSINLAPQTLADPSMPLYVERHLARHGVPAQALCFEVPFNELLTHAAAMVPVGRALKALGCRIAIGSVGRESVAFKPLQAIGADFVKIDSSLVRELHREPVAHAKTQAIHRVCKAAGMQTVAEFVEEPTTLEKLKAIGVHYAQGFGICRPAPLSELEQGGGV
jgi:EAL domain-containing protein (putative c-di-GMP-specific phosphodiesterase class I)